MSEKLSASDNPANREHMCAKQVVHEKWGRGDCIPTMHADPTKEGIVEWYDVMFPHGIETRVPTKDLKVTLEASHIHSSYNKKKKKSNANEAYEGYGEGVIKAAKMYVANGDVTYEMAAKKYDVSVDEVKKCASEMEKNEAKMDPVDKKELKKKYDDREDGDIDNDGDEDESDKYLHMRRKAISKALKTKNKEK